MRAPRRALASRVCAGVVLVASCRGAGRAGDAEICPGRDALQVPALLPQVGFDERFSIAVSPGCAAARAGHISWRQLSGAPLRALTFEDDGFRLTARTQTLADALGAPLPWGLVPLSPRTRGEALLEATWRDDRGRQARRQVRVAAAARARGLPNTPVGARVYLGGEGWRLVAAPPGSVATLAPSVGGAANLLPDVVGDWRLTDGAGRTLTLRSARYDQTPLDCGRSGCHAAITGAAAASPMTTVLARGLTPAPGGHGAAFGPAYPGCALGCHATGEPGLSDGGFVHVAGELGVTAELPAPWAALPRPLRRLGGVGCLGCHGPGALPEASARWSVLRADVCATCHDAPPRYGHVAAWRQTTMAGADRDARTRTDDRCARCHTTWGFLTAQGTRADRHPPPQIGPLGITCAACHAVHAESTGAAPAALLRLAATPPTLAGAVPSAAERSLICLPCHTPDPDAAIPSATAAALWLGRGGLDPATGAALNGPAPHAGVAGGCVGCHRGGPSALERGAGHAFGAPAATCVPCHAQPLPPSDLAARARRLLSTWQALSQTETPAVVHAGGLRVDRRTPLGRAGWDLLLVLEDPAAAAHNAPYARALLAAAEQVFASPHPGGTR